MRLFLLGILAGALLATAAPPAATLWLGSPVRIGDSKESVMRRVEPYFELVRAQPSDPGRESWALFEKGSERSPLVHRGNLLFANSRLIFASRNWRTTTDAEGIQTMTSLVAAAERLEKDGFSDCRLRTDTSEEPKYRHRELRVVCGGKWLRVLIWKVEGDVEQAQISEELPGPAAQEANR
jgi:hypothetical protein